MGGYDQTVAEMQAFMLDFAQQGFVNIVGGCCGTTPEHIKLIADAVQSVEPRKIPTGNGYTTLSGLELLEFRPELNFVNVGEQNQCDWFKKICSTILNSQYDEAISVARQQVESGQIIDINMDEGLLDGEKP